jgi:hypothetical protein
MDGFEFIASVDCVRTKAKPKARMAALRAAILSLGFMSLYTWRQLYNNYRAKKLQETT